MEITSNPAAWAPTADLFVAGSTSTTRADTPKVERRPADHVKAVTQSTNTAAPTR